MKRPIVISLSPNTERDDVLLAIKRLLQPVYWYDFMKTEELESEFEKYFGDGYKALAVNSGRSAEYLILKSLGITYGDEVIVQALTCVAVPNSVSWTGAQSIFADVGDDYNIDSKDLSKKISVKTKAIIIQNSFGMPADYNSIKKVILKNKKKIYIIEDCALSLGAKYKGKKLGTLGDVAFFSFGRDKVISSVFGGMILCKNKRLYDLIKTERDSLDYPGPSWLFQQLLHPIIFSLALPVYNFGWGRFTLGKTIIFLSQKIGLISKAVYKEEESGKKPKHFPKKMPGALSALALNQLKKLDRFNSHRLKIANFYFNNLSKTKFKLPLRDPGSIWVRFPVLSEKAPEIYRRFKLKGILLGDWYKECVVPVKDLSSVGFIRGTCPNAESIKGHILNLPTYPGFEIDDAKKLLNFLK